MESTTELILHGHFSKLRDQVNQSIKAEQSGDEMTGILKRVFNYLKKQELRGSLDTEGTQLYQHIAGVLDNLKAGEEMPVPGKLPMQKAKGRGGKGEQKKTGS